MMLDEKLANPPKILGAAAAIAAVTGFALILLPSFAPQVEASEPAALTRGDKLMIAGADCTQQDWPNISPACLRRGDATSLTAPTQVRMVAPR